MPIFAVSLERTAEVDLLIEAETPEDAEKVALDEADDVFDMGSDDDTARAHPEPIDLLKPEDVRHYDASEEVWVGEFVEVNGRRTPKGEWVKLGDAIARAREAAESDEAMRRPTPGQLDFEGNEVPAR